MTPPTAPGDPTESPGEPETAPTHPDLTSDLEGGQDGAGGDGVLVDDPGFAPKEPTDGRQRGDWQTRYPEPEARRAILFEASYVFVVHCLTLIAMALTGTGWPQDWIGVTEPEWAKLSHWLLAWLGGMLGGSLFAMKWMYHSVAKGLWNRDRRLWRIFTPLLSAGVGLTVVVLSAARIIPIFGADLVGTNTGAVGVAILVGYFSDQTISKLADMAEGHLGRAGRRASRPGPDEQEATEPS
ncbi:hypothetical protein [Streptomyces sp. SID13031]|uniref:hypothetical protein n=1 Tax=Streptomyces sp. SID13031 TaxID=2706046 RepID=UPI0013C75A45|nr:hypothetical protein [Streptomyces sp. SID13031]NEA36094.1 hypothetical protein [Streptomyces sp. SID13031]